MKYKYKTKLDICSLGKLGAECIYERLIKNEFKMKCALYGTELHHVRVFTKIERVKIKYFAKGLLWGGLDDE